MGKKEIFDKKNSITNYITQQIDEKVYSINVIIDGLSDGGILRRQ